MVDFRKESIARRHWRQGEIQSSRGQRMTCQLDVGGIVLQHQYAYFLILHPIADRASPASNSPASLSSMFRQNRTCASGPAKRILKHGAFAPRLDVFYPRLLRLRTFEGVVDAFVRKAQTQPLQDFLLRSEVLQCLLVRTVKL